MAKSKSKPKSPFQGRWRIISMTDWDEDFMNAEVQAYIEFDAKGRGQFQFGYVRGDIGYEECQRDGKPAVEFTWDGTDELDPVSGRGWAVPEGDNLNGVIAFDDEDESGFVAGRAG
jgi:hypothetical protein